MSGFLSYSTTGAFKFWQMMSSRTSYGAQAIADCIGRNYRQTVYLLSTKKLPAQKIGATWIGSRAKLRACLLGDHASNDGGA
jgi:hypothetical protein